MQKLRALVTLGLEARQKAGLKVRQPLKELRVKNYELPIEYEEIAKDELNVKNILKDDSIENEVMLDTHITEELRKEGQYRELLRAVQDMRKVSGLMPADTITLSVETNIDGQEIINAFKDNFLKTAGIKSLVYAENSGTEIKIDDLLFTISLEK